MMNVTMVGPSKLISRAQSLSNSLRAKDGSGVDTDSRKDHVQINRGLGGSYARYDTAGVVEFNQNSYNPWAGQYDSLSIDRVENGIYEIEETKDSVLNGTRVEKARAKVSESGDWILA